MKAEIKLIRAVGSEFIRRKLRGMALIVGVIALAALVGAIYLATLNAWWWLLAGVVISADILLIVFYFLSAFVVRLLRPKLTKSQAVGVSEFVDKLERVADSLGTPVFIIVIKVIIDVIWARQPGYIQVVATDSATLHKDFIKLHQLFT